MLLVFATIVPLLVVAVGQQYLYYEESRAQAGESALTLARGAALVVSRELQARIAALQVLALSSSLQARDFDAFRQRAQDVVSGLYPRSNILLLREDGQQLMNLASPPGAALPVRVHLETTRQVFATGRAGVSSLFQSTGLRRLVVSIEVPVKRPDGTVAFSLALNPNLEIFDEVLRQQKIPRGWVVSVFDQQGVIVARIPSPEQFVGQKAAAGLLPHLLQEQEGIVDTVSLEGIPLISGFSHAGSYGWSVGVGIPGGALTGSAVRWTLHTLAVGTVALLVGLLGAVAMARNISGPIASLRGLAADLERNATMDEPRTGLRETDEVAQALYAVEQDRRSSKQDERRAQRALDESEERLRQEIALQASEAKFRGILEAAPDAMVVADPQGRIQIVNAQTERLFGYRRDELIGHQVSDIIPDGFAQRLIADAMRTADEALAQQIGTGIELSARRRDGTEFPIEIMLSPLESAEGILVTVAIRDITTRKKAEAHLQAEAQLLQKMDELNRSNDELEQFAYIASHDLQEPLRMVASYTQLLARRYKGRLDADADEFIAFAVDGANRMQRLIQDLLAYSRVGTNREALREISSEEALLQALGNLHAAIEESGAIVTHDPLPDVLGDEMQMVQLFQNLVANAVKYHGAATPRVHVSAAREGGRWIFSVQDNGLGIDPQYFERIFGMFQRLHKRKEFAGTGIGLAICKKIVEQHGGSISVESQPGQGSTFRFSLVKSKGKTGRRLEVAT